MGLLDKWRRPRGGARGLARKQASADLDYLRHWVATHTGVEAFVEPQTTVTEVTVVLVAVDGEWTRRRTGGEAGAKRLSRQLDIPVYDVQKVGYPQRMRDRMERQRILRKREEQRQRRARFERGENPDTGRELS